MDQLDDLLGETLGATQEPKHRRPRPQAEAKVGWGSDPATSAAPIAGAGGLLSSLNPFNRGNQQQQAQSPVGSAQQVSRLS